MKSRQPQDGAAAATASQRRKRKNRQRLGGKGGGLSLESFANAKSSTTGYNPALIKKQRELYRNAKIVKKYKRSLKQQTHDERHLPTVSIPESRDGTENANEKKPKKKKTNRSLQSFREEYEKKQEEKERARKEREAMIQAKKEERQRAEAKRKALREKMFKRTSTGQPVMKYRIEHLLENILQSSSN
ncbi:hypothetical protein Taro_047142 [Colocasia esculenta]|uniref:rRNA-processing protein FYV7 n=1 Tax=Colocasia esculenta TaxID=4460 RepID=A0A843X6D4_COLES|nr:hypothetical protein [Colocasia esculenta]